jgi:hypothetical protein
MTITELEECDLVGMTGCLPLSHPTPGRYNKV